MISPGYHVFRGSDGVWRYAEPDERFVRINGPEELIARVAGGSVRLDEPGVADLVAALTERGVMGRPAPARERTPAQVHLAGDGPVVERLAELLDHRLVTTGPVDEDAVVAADVVVSCAGHLPDAAWQRIDRWCTRHATAWHRAHAEGRRAVVGPLFVPAATASYHDTRGRRLAASPTPGELQDLWKHWDTGAASPSVGWSAPLAAVVAGLLAADVIAHLDGGVVPSAGHQVVVDPATMSTSRHPVLPLPVLDRLQ